MANSNQTFIERVLDGREREEGGRRVSLPEGHWRHAWEIFKGRLGRLFLVNLLLILTFAPIIYLYFRRSITLLALQAAAPNGSGLGVGYPSIPGSDLTGLMELSVFQADIVYFSLFIAAGFVAALGIAGGIYLVRNLLRTDGVFDFKDFLRGIRYTYWNILEAVLLFTTVLFVVQSLANLADYYLALGIGNTVWLIISKVIGYIIVALVLLLSLWMASLSANYKQGPWEIIRNAVVMLVKLFLPSVFFAAFALFPFLFIVTNVEFLVVFGVALLIAIAFSSALLIWMAFSQWAFDALTNPVLASEPAEKNKISAKEDQVANEETRKQELKLLMLAYGKSELLSRPMQPLCDGLDAYVLPSEFTRETLCSAAENKSRLVEEADAYAAAHQSEEKYVEYNKQFENRDTALKTDKKKRAKGAPKMLNER